MAFYYFSGLKELIKKLRRVSRETFTMTLDRKNLGKVGENEAARYLKSLNYRIIERNIRIGRIGEIDIIAQKIERKWLIFGRKTIVFVEVKTLFSSGNSDFRPEMHINKAKLDRIKRLGMAYLSQKYGILDIHWQIDVVAIEIDHFSGHPTNIRHFENVAL